MVSRVLPLVVLAAVLTNGCVASPANRGFWQRYDKHPTGDEQVLVGVVNGMYKLDPQWTRKYLDIYASDLPEEERRDLSMRYVIRVGYKRMASGVVFLPIVSVKHGNKSSDFVLLPQGWVADPAAISSNSKVINVGDLVRVRIQTGRFFDFLDGLVRKCSDQPASGEDEDWNLGCRTYQGYDRNGYAGEKYYVRPF
jgi:hypothetical protein